MARLQTHLESQCLDTRLVPSIVIVHLFDNDYSINPPPGPIVDPTITVGDTIRWVWEDSNLDQHSTTSAAGQAESWGSPLILPPFEFDHTFTNVGKFNYYCLLHGADLGGGMVAGMAGSITVTPPLPPTVTGVTITSGAAQRSRVTVLKVEFSQIVNLPTNPADAFQLKRQGDDASVTLSGLVTTPGHTEVVLTFTGGAIDSGPGINAPFSLSDGRY